MNLRGVNADFIDYKDQNIYLDDDIREFFFDEGIKKSFWKHLKESVILDWERYSPINNGTLLRYNQKPFFCKDK